MSPTQRERHPVVYIMASQRNGTLLVGDFGWSGSVDFNKPVYIESLKRFSRIDTDLMLPGHGLLYFHQPRRRVQQALNSALMQWR